MELDASKLSYKEINDQIRANDSVVLNNVLGQRYIASGASNKEVVINGIPGNALGSYFNGGKITVNGDGQDALGDTMNEGTIAVHGNVGDTVGYAMRGGKIFIKGNAGYRVGIHMKAYKEKNPLIVIGGKVGSFLGEYLAGGTIVVLGIGEDERVVNFFPCTGMHGGKVFIKNKIKDVVFPEYLNIKKVDSDDLKELSGYIDEYCQEFSIDKEKLLEEEYLVITPSTSNPYKQLYVK